MSKFVAVLVAGLMAGTILVQAQEAAAEEKTITGVVVLAKDVTGAVKGISIEGVAAVCAVVLDEMGMSLQDQEGQTVTVKGIMQNSMLKVSGVEVAVEPEVEPEPEMEMEPEPELEMEPEAEPVE